MIQELQLNIIIKFLLPKRQGLYSPVKLNGKVVYIPNVVGLHLGTRFTWLELPRRKIYWIISEKSQVSSKNKLVIYKTIIKPIWSYGLLLCPAAGKAKITILQRFHNKILRHIINAPNYILTWGYYIKTGIYLLSKKGFTSSAPDIRLG